MLQHTVNTPTCPPIRTPDFLLSIVSQKIQRFTCTSPRPDALSAPHKNPQAAASTALVVLVDGTHRTFNSTPQCLSGSCRGNPRNPFVSRECGPSSNPPPLKNPARNNLRIQQYFVCFAPFSASDPQPCHQFPLTMACHGLVKHKFCTSSLSLIAVSWSRVRFVGWTIDSL